MTRVGIPSRMLRWAIERSDIPEEDLRRRFDKLSDWIDGKSQPTLRQLEEFARATHTPIGYLFLNEPPDEPAPIPDFRTIAGQPIARPSRNLLDTIYVCQQRQEWFRNHARATGQERLTFIGSARVDDDVVSTASKIRDILGFDLRQREQFRTWAEALRHFVEQVDRIGVLVMMSGIVGNNTARTLDPEEFRGFVLSDDFAPLIFINGADTKAAQMFTLAHELAHLWLGQSALSDATARMLPDQKVEYWCNRVAAELLVPLEAVRAAYKEREPVDEALGRLTRQFKVSSLVILRRMYDAGFLKRDDFWRLYDSEVKRLRKLTEASGGGGDFYRTTLARVSHRFARAVIVAAWEGSTTFTEAFHLLGCRSTNALRELGHLAGVNV